MKPLDSSSGSPWSRRPFESLQDLEEKIPYVCKLAGTGDVFLASGGNSALFRWSPDTGSKLLLQANEEHPAVSGQPVAGGMMDGVGLNLQVNALGHATMINQVAVPGERDHAGIVLYDGSSYHLIEVREEGMPGGSNDFSGFGTLFLNDNDQAAFFGSAEPPGFGSAGIFLGSPSGPLKEIAMRQDPAPLPGVKGATRSVGPRA